MKRGADNHGGLKKAREEGNSPALFLPSKWKCQTCSCEWDTSLMTCGACEAPKPGVSEADIQKAKENTSFRAPTGGGLFGPASSGGGLGGRLGGGLGGGLFGAASSGDGPFGAASSGGLGGGTFGAAASSGGGLFGGAATSSGGGLFGGGGGGLFGGAATCSSGLLGGGGGWAQLDPPAYSPPVESITVAVGSDKDFLKKVVEASTPSLKVGVDAFGRPVLELRALVKVTPELAKPLAAHSDASMFLVQHLRAGASPEVLSGLLSGLDAVGAKAAAVMPSLWETELLQKLGTAWWSKVKEPWWSLALEAGMLDVRVAKIFMGLDENREVLMWVHSNGDTLAHAAASLGDVELLQLLRAEELAVRSQQGYTPIFNAVAGLSLGTVEFLAGKQHSATMGGADGKLLLSPRLLAQSLRFILNTCSAYCELQMMEEVGKRLGCYLKLDTCILSRQVQSMNDAPGDAAEICSRIVELLDLEREKETLQQQAKPVTA